jgi:hypothetical protein
MQSVERRWLLARRDALIDRALACAVPVAALLVPMALETLPLPVVTGLGGVAVGVCLTSIKKPQLRVE